MSVLEVTQSFLFYAVKILKSFETKKCTERNKRNRYCIISNKLNTIRSRFMKQTKQKRRGKQRCRNFYVAFSFNCPLKPESKLQNKFKKSQKKK